MSVLISFILILAYFTSHQAELIIAAGLFCIGAEIAALKEG